MHQANRPTIDETLIAFLPRSLSDANTSAATITAYRPENVSIPPKDHA